MRVVTAIADVSSGVPAFFSLSVAADFAAGNGWASDPNKALCFGRKQDAELFVKKYLPHMEPMVDYRLVTVEDK